MLKPRNIVTRHARSRAIQRHGVDLSLAHIEREIKRGRAIVFENEGRDVQKMFIAVGRLLVPIVFNSRRRVVITTLPNESAEVLRARAKMSEKKRWPSWCCQRCGEPVGFIGRTFSFLRFKPFHFH